MNKNQAAVSHYFLMLTKQILAHFCSHCVIFSNSEARAAVPACDARANVPAGDAAVSPVHWRPCERWSEWHTRCSLRVAHSWWNAHVRHTHQVGDRAARLQAWWPRQGAKSELTTSTGRRGVHPVAGSGEHSYRRAGRHSAPATTAG